MIVAQINVHDFEIDNNWKLEKELKVGWVFGRKMKYIASENDTNQRGVWTVHVIM